MSKRAIVGVSLGAVIGFSAAAALFLIPSLLPANRPEEITHAYFVDTYTQNYSTAWDRLSSADKSARSRDEYLTFNPSAGEAQAALLSRLAKWGTYETLAVASADPSRATVTAQFRFPDVHQPEIVELLSRASDPGVDQGTLMAQLLALHEAGKLRYQEGNVGFDLVSEGNRWRIALHWDQSVVVHLEAAVSDDLPWEFYPEVDEISARPGELVSAGYIARNNSAQTITAKAIHEIDPEQAARYFETIQCFCFTEQTLAAGEERAMMLMFRIDFAAPRSLTDLDNLYTFYTLDSFPSGAES